MIKKIFLILVLLASCTGFADAKKNKSAFTCWQLPVMIGNNIGNSYVFQTQNGKVIVMDGGRPDEALFLRGFIGALGNEVEAWFISHPHDDHMGALWEILKDRKGMKINHIYHSRFSDSLVDCEQPYNQYAHDFYAVLDSCSIPVTDLREPGLTGNIDGFNFKILGVTNEEFRTNPYNNSSTVIKVWDDKKSMLFLGDCGAEAGDKLMNGPFGGKELDCDYMQMAHHGQNGVTEDFYKKVNFRVCLWPTAWWIWTNDFGGGPGSGTLKTMDTRRWMEEKGIKEHHVYSIEGITRID